VSQTAPTNATETTVKTTKMMMRHAFASRLRRLAAGASGTDGCMHRRRYPKTARAPCNPAVDSLSKPLLWFA